MKTKIKTPNYNIERRLLRNCEFVAGVDEAGVGPLAGPVVAAAVILDPKNLGCSPGRKNWWRGIRDSKQLTHKRREECVRLILKNATAFGIGSASAREIDEVNILQARLLAMKRAVKNLKTVPHRILVDGTFRIPNMEVLQKCIASGDEKVLSIACASIVAKVTRDNILLKLHEQFPQYEFARHKGYATQIHRERLKLYGPCEHHRYSFAPVRSAVKGGLRRGRMEAEESAVFIRQ